MSDQTKPFTDERAQEIAAAVEREVGEQMGELYAALPDLIHDHTSADEYADLPRKQRKAAVQQIAEIFGGEGYEYGYPVP